MKAVKLAWPVPRSAPITQGFGENPPVYARFGLAGHNGLDFGVPLGTPVRAAAAGVVQRVETRPDGYGRHVRLVHAGFITIYAHLARLAVKAGQEAAAGQVIGWSGNSGFSSGPHLHFEVRLEGSEANGFGGAVDPLPLLSGEDSTFIEDLFPAYARLVTTTALNLRLFPSFADTLRGRLRTGDVVTLAGPQQVMESGFTFVPVVFWVASEYLQPFERAQPECGQKHGDFHILHDLSTVFNGLSTDFDCFRIFGRCGFPRKTAVFPYKKHASRWMGCRQTKQFSTVFSTGGQHAD